MSAIDDIYLKIANLDIGGVRCRNLPDVTLEVAQGDLPLRIMVPSAKAEGAFIAIGDMNAVEWAIRDLCLWAPLGAGGIERFAEPMVQYIRAYVAAIKTIRAPTDASFFTGYVIELGPRPWAEDHYWAVDIMLSVKEIL